MSETAFILDKLNAPPFSMELNSLAFANMSPQQLQQLAYDVFAHFHPKKSRYFAAQEAPQQTAARLDMFCRMVKYRAPNEGPAFYQGLEDGSMESILPLIKWLLTQQSDLTKRAFVGYHLMEVPLPPEMLSMPDEETLQLLQELQGLQQEFKALHRAVDTAKTQGRDLSKLKIEVDQLTEDKEKLQEHVDQRRDRSASLPKDLVAATSRLQAARDAQAELASQLVGQRKQMESAEHRLSRIKARINTSRAGQVDGSLLGTMERSVEDLKYQVMEKLPKELEKRQTRLRVLEQAASCTEDDFGRMESDKASLDAELSDLKRRREARLREQQQSKEFQGLRQQQQMAQMVERKREEIGLKLKRLEDKRDSLMRQYEKLVEELGLGAAELATGNQGVSEQELHSKQSEIRSKLEEFKAKKQELDGVKAELLVLGRTDEVLQRLLSDSRLRVRHLESQQGVEGATEIESDLQKISEAKSSVDEAKGATLDSISSMVNAINQKIKQRQDQLVPKIKELKDLRARVAESEGAVDRINTESGQQLGRLEQEVEKLMAEYLENEGKYHQLSSLISIADAQIRSRVSNRAEGEKLETILKERAAYVESQSGELGARAQEAQGREAVAPLQKEMLDTLKALLQAKLQASSSRGGGAMGAMRGMAPATELQLGAANVLTF